MLVRPTVLHRSGSSTLLAGCHICFFPVISIAVTFRRWSRVTLAGPVGAARHRRCLFVQVAEADLKRAVVTKMCRELLAALASP